LTIIRMPIFFALILIVGSIIGALWQHPEGASVSAVASPPTSHSGSKRLHLIEDCSEYMGTPGSFCTIASSDVTAIPSGSKVFYLQAPIASTGLLDSNVVLDAGEGNRAVGRCTLDLVSHAGLCTISDGIGRFVGFQARIDVSVAPAESVKFDWRGTSSFTREDAR